MQDIWMGLMAFGVVWALLSIAGALGVIADAVEKLPDDL